MKNLNKDTNVASLSDVSTRRKIKWDFLALSVMVLVLIAVSAGFAFSNTPNGKESKVKKNDAINAAASCGTTTKVAFIIDYSGSIPSSAYQQIKDSTLAAFNSLAGKNVQTDVIAFSTNAYRVNSGWLPLNGPNEVLLQQNAVNSIPFSSGGSTNWQAALQLVQPDTNFVIMLTDGDPTTHVGESPYNGVDSSNLDQFYGFAAADVVRSRNTFVVPVGVGNLNRGFLNRLGGGQIDPNGNNHVYGGSFNNLLAIFSDAVAKIGLAECPQELTSTLGIIATNSKTGATLPVKIDYTGSPFGGPQFDTTSGWDYKTSTTDSNWGFNTSYDSSTVPFPLSFDGAYCRSGEWSAASPIVGSPHGSGVNAAAGSFAPGTTVRCEYKFRDKRVPVTPDIKMVVDASAKQVYEGAPATSVGVTVTNIGTIRLTNVSTTRSSCLKSELEVNESTTCDWPIDSIPLGAQSPKPIDIQVRATATIDPATQFFSGTQKDGAIFEPVPNNNRVGDLRIIKTKNVDVLRIKLPI